MQRAIALPVIEASDCPRRPTAAFDSMTATLTVSPTSRTSEEAQRQSPSLPPTPAPRDGPVWNCPRRRSQGQVRENASFPDCSRRRPNAAYMPTTPTVSPTSRVHRQVQGKEPSQPPTPAPRDCSQRRPTTASMPKTPAQHPSAQLWVPHAQQSCPDRETVVSDHGLVQSWPQPQPQRVVPTLSPTSQGKEPSPPQTPAPRDGNAPADRSQRRVLVGMPTTPAQQPSAQLWVPHAEQSSPDGEGVVPSFVQSWPQSEPQRVVPTLSPTSRTSRRASNVREDAILTMPLEVFSPLVPRRDDVSISSFPPGPTLLYPSIGSILTSPLSSHVKSATLAPRVRVPVVTFLEEPESSSEGSGEEPSERLAAVLPQEDAPSEQNKEGDSYS